MATEGSVNGVCDGGISESSDSDIDKPGGDTGLVNSSSSSKVVEIGAIGLKPAQERKRRISSMAFRRVVIELDLTVDFFSTPPYSSVGGERRWRSFVERGDRGGDEDDTEAVGEDNEEGQVMSTSLADSRTRLPSSVMSWFMVSRR